MVGQRVRYGRSASSALRMVTAAGVLVATALVFTPANAHAADATTAEELFQQARALVEQGKYAEACPKLEESHKLEPAVGTQFNLADCYEHVGRTASAYETFRNVASIARAAGKFERERSAKERIKALEPKLARFHIVVKDPAPGLEVRVDDVVLRRDVLDSAFPIDPGTHQVRVTAPDRAAWETISTATERATTNVDVPALVDTRPKSVVVVAPTPGKTQRTLALVAGGVGVVAIGVGAVAGILALSHHSNAENACPSGTYDFRCPTEDGASEWNASRAAGDVSTVGFIAGGVFLAGAAALWFTAPKARVNVGLAGPSLVTYGTF